MKHPKEKMLAFVEQYEMEQQYKQPLSPVEKLELMYFADWFLTKKIGEPRIMLIDKPQYCAKCTSFTIKGGMFVCKECGRHHNSLSAD